MSRKPWLIFFITAALVVGGRIPVIVAPPWDIDEGLYAAVGQAIGRGELLYRDVWDNKPPAIYFLFDFIEKNFSHYYTDFRLVATLFLIATAGVIFFLARRTLSPGKPYWSLAIFSFLATVPIFETHISNAEIFFLLLTSLAIALTVMMEWFGWAKRCYFLVGAMLAVGFLFKVVVIFDALAILTLLALKEGINIRERLAHLTLGVVLVLILPAIYLLTNNLTADFIRAAFLNNFGYVGTGNLATVSFVDLANPWITVTGKLLALGAVVWAVRRYYGRHPTPVALYCLWFAFTLFGALLSGRPYLHYLIASQGAMALLVPEFFAGVWPLSKLRTLQARDWIKGLAVVTAVTATLILGFWGKVQLVASTPELSAAARGYYANAYAYISGQISQQQFFNFYGPSVALNQKLAQYLREKSSPNARIYIWGNAPWVYYLSDRNHAAKYLVAYQTTFVKEAKEEIMAELRRHPPDLIIITNEPEFYSEAGLPAPPFPEFQQFLASGYRLKDQVAPADIYERLALADAGTP